MSRKLVLPLFAILWLCAVSVSAAPLSQSRQTANQLLAGMHQATWVTQGTGNHILYIFFDPNCPYCHKLYTELQPLIKPQHLQLHWIPVGMLGESSVPKAAAILQAKDPLAAFLENENNYDMRVEGPGGGIAPAKHITAKTRMELAQNLNLLEEQNIGAIPVMVVRLIDGQGFMTLGAPGEQYLQRVLKLIQPEKNARHG